MAHAVVSFTFFSPFSLPSLDQANGVLWDGKISTGEAVGFICLYIIYVVVVIVGRQIYQSRKSKVVDPIEGTG